MSGYYKKYLVMGSGLLAYLFLAGVVHGADFNAVPATGIFGIKNNITVNIKIDTGGESVNAAQAKLKFNPDILEVESVSKDGSIFNFWLQGPVFSNKDGTIEFIGGAPNGVSGSSLQALQISFVSRGVGSGNLTFADASITAADGTGTNILAKANGAKFTISSSSAVPITATPPVQIIRTPVKVSGMPAAPDISIPLYPNPDNWHGSTAQFTASWKLPPDISGVSTAFNSNPYFKAPAVSEGLFEAKTLPSITKDGIYYFHVRFQNNNEWGPTAHYRIAVDSQPPVPFKINVGTGLTSDNPSPKLGFAATDALSGVDHYEIFVNSERAMVTNQSEFLLPPHPPGEYMVRVRALDKANNGVEDKVKIEILPIETPTITFITKKILLGADSLFDIKGVAIPNASVIVTFEDKNKFLVLQNESKTNAQGEYEFQLDKELRKGDYLVSVKAKDSRGAMSLPAGPVSVTYADKAVISFFGLDITLAGLTIILAVAGVLAVGWFWRKTLLRWARLQRESTIINRDIKNAFDMIRKDLGKISEIIKKERPAETTETEFNTVNKKIKDTLDKVEKYSSEDIERLR
ncbi:MAG: hypothetical protein A3C69_02480 [Candidatus Yanofskybacteria bacterium RIFCSPHIGHO2_02_FULL_43_12]|nr:MAG: hypothetical protein A3C69_02480 [Candidatus Yanofskybacteria bacterium RIFCSPHIGHO2_02_FULL_43_12]